MGNLKPYTGPFQRPELLHLLRRTLFGVNQDDLRHFANSTLAEILDLVVPTTPPLPTKEEEKPLRTYFSNSDPRLDTMEAYLNDKGEQVFAVEWGKTWVDTPIPSNVITNPANARHGSLKNWWTGKMIHQEQTAYERMVQFYQTVLSTESSVIGDPNMAYFLQNLFREFAFGNYKALIKKITLEPGMLIYLNGYLNTKAAPDENYGRELQELFTVGKGPGSGYTEDDVKAAARVLTGWKVQRRVAGGNVLPYTYFSAASHDTNPKQFSAFYGNKTIIYDTSITDKGSFDSVEERRAFVEMEQLIDMIFSTEEVSRFICRRLWTFFAYYDITPEIEKEVIEPLAEIFRQYDDDPDQLRYVLQAMFGSEYFFKQEHRGCMIKSAIDFHVGIMRMTKFPIPEATKLDAQYYLWGLIRAYNTNAGQDINDPPNVAGWPAYYQVPSYYELWVDTATYPVRKTQYEALARNTLSISRNSVYGGTSSPSYDFKVKYQWFEFAARFENPGDPNALIAEACELMLGAPLSQDVQTKLKTNYLLGGQANDHYWTDGWDAYKADPNTSIPEGRRVPGVLQELFMYLMSSAEFHLC
ncbi:MAG: DUF1800 family protein [Saprospiraceae bacterium]|nr:DUF1800 family protein [Saprospiraceae bacterium]